MKTIDEAARENQYPYNTSKFGMWAVEITEYISRNWFKKGAAFAQRWIPVEEELPIPHKKILVIDSISNSESYGQFSLNMEWFHCHKSTNVLSKSEITHWRPINLK